MKFILHCQKINASNYHLITLKTCAHQNFGLTRIEQKDAKGSNLDFASRTSILTLALGICHWTDQIAKHHGPTRFCKVTVLSQSFKHNFVTKTKHDYKERYLDRYIKVWEGLEGACTVSHLRCGYQYFSSVRSNLHGESAYEPSTWKT